MISILCGLLTFGQWQILAMKNVSSKKKSTEILIRHDWISHSLCGNLQRLLLVLFMSNWHSVFSRIVKIHINTPGSQYSQWGWMAWGNIPASSTVSTHFVFGFIRIIPKLFQENEFEAMLINFRIGKHLHSLSVIFSCFAFPQIMQ